MFSYVFYREHFYTRGLQIDAFFLREKRARRQIADSNGLRSALPRRASTGAAALFMALTCQAQAICR